MDVLDLLRHRHGVDRALAGLAVQQLHRLHGAGQEVGLDLADDVRDVLEHVIIGPARGVLQVEQEAVGEVRRLAGGQGRQDLPRHVLVGVVDVLDVDAAVPSRTPPRSCRTADPLRDSSSCSTRSSGRRRSPAASSWRGTWRRAGRAQDSSFDSPLCCASFRSGRCFVALGRSYGRGIRMSKTHACRAVNADVGRIGTRHRDRSGNSTSIPAYHSPEIK